MKFVGFLYPPQTEKNLRTFCQLVTGAGALTETSNLTVAVNQGPVKPNAKAMVKFSTCSNTVQINAPDSYEELKGWLDAQVDIEHGPDSGGFNSI